MKSGSSHVPANASERTFILYDSSGEIVHAHTEITLPGADPPAMAELERRAVASAQEFLGDKAKTLRVLAVSHGDLKVGIRYRVDVERGALVAVEGKGGAAG